MTEGDDVCLTCPVGQTSQTIESIPGYFPEIKLQYRGVERLKTQHCREMSSLIFPL